jgi:flagellar secretion chaperone FliS
MNLHVYRPSVGASLVDKESINQQDRNQIMFIPVHVRAASAYKAVGVETIVNGADSHLLIQLVLNSFLETLNAARAHMVQGNVTDKCRHMGRAMHLLQDGLDAALDIEQGGEIATRLRDLYDYCSMRLALGNARNDLGILDEVRGLIEPIAQAWGQIRPVVNARGLQ